MNSIPFYIPNVICYVRLAQTLACLFIFRDHPLLAFTLLLSATVLDAVDGYLAVKLNQTSQYGAVLDYLTDRVHTILLITFLIMLYPQYLAIFSIMLVIDVASHMARLYGTIFSGNKYHKDGTTAHSLLALYYGPSKNFMRYTCFSYDLFLCLLFLGHSIGYMPLLNAALVLALPGFVIKNTIHVLQGLDCFSLLASPSYQLRSAADPSEV